MLQKLLAVLPLISLFLPQSPSHSPPQVSDYPVTENKRQNEQKTELFSLWQLSLSAKHTRPSSADLLYLYCTEIQRLHSTRHVLRQRLKL